MSGNEPMGIDNAMFRLQAATGGRRLSGAGYDQEHDSNNKAGLEEASRQFESLLLNMMIREMRATVSESGLLPPSMAQDIFTSMLDEQYADNMAERGGIGLHRLLIDQLKDVASEKGRAAREIVDDEH